MEKLTPKVWSWASILELQARQQIIETAHMDIVYPYIAVMPDVHYGLGCSVGVAIPTVGGIFPAAVGVDIGCGMIAVRTQYTAADVHPEVGGRDLVALRYAIEEAIPLSAGNYNRTLTRSARTRVEILEGTPGAEAATEISPNWHMQLGSLGSGNHFIEISLDEEDRVWLFLHSGSRGVGNRLAQKHINIARQIAHENNISVPNRDLAYLTEDTPEFDAYIRDLRWAQDFALFNREEMMDRVARCFEKWIGGQVRRTEQVNCHHNYTEQTDLTGFLDDTIEDHAWLSRKGAINAELGRPGVIPGSMGTRSYVVSGLGNAAAFCTAPHGAGRQLSRGAAKRHLTMEGLEDAMKGIEWSHREAFLDESPAAYKDIDTVMADAADLVEIRHTLRQIVNIKGD